MKGIIPEKKEVKEVIKPSIWSKVFFATEFGKAFIPEFIRPKLRGYLDQAGIYEIPYYLFGVLFYISLAITTFSYIVLWPVFVKLSILELLIYTFLFWFFVELALALVMMGIVYVYVDVKIFQRTKAMEDVLADFLSLFSDNIKTGMTVDKALWLAVKPEFGVLAKEIRIAAKMVMTGDDIGEALAAFVNKYDSIMLKRSFNLIIESMRGGGQLSGTIDRVIDDIKKTKVLKERMIANTISYTIFITIIVLFIAPLLFSLSYYLLLMIDSFSQNILGTATVASGLGEIKIAISLSDFKIFAQMATVTIAFFASMIISIINRGDVKSGLKYVPAFMAGTYVMYMIFMALLNVAFSNLISTL